MASLPNRTLPTSEEAVPLTSDQWWELFHKLRLGQQADYAEFGGPVAFFRKERDADVELP